MLLWIYYQQYIFTLGFCRVPKKCNWDVANEGWLFKDKLVELGTIVNLPEYCSTVSGRVAESTEEVSNLRPPRFIHEDGIIRPYNRVEAEGYDLFEVWLAFWIQLKFSYLQGSIKDYVTKNLTGICGSCDP